MCGQEAGSFLRASMEVVVVVARHVRRETSHGAGKLFQSRSGGTGSRRGGKQLVQLRIHLFEFPAIQLWQFRNDFLRAHIAKMPCLPEVVNFCAPHRDPDLWPLGSCYSAKSSLLAHIFLLANHAN